MASNEGEISKLFFKTTIGVKYHSFLHSNMDKCIYGTVSVHHKKESTFVNEPDKCEKFTLFLNLMKAILKK
jgi:hypothetical protein